MAYVELLKNKFKWDAMRDVCKLVLLFIFILGGHANAQEEVWDGHPIEEDESVFEIVREQAEEQTEVMRKILDLDQRQSEWVRTINFIHGHELFKMCSVFVQNADTLEGVYKELHNSRDTAFSRILSEEQFDTYLELKMRNIRLTFDPYKLTPSDLEELPAVGGPEYYPICMKDDFAKEYARKENQLEGQKVNIPQALHRNLINSDGRPIDFSYEETNSAHGKEEEISISIMERKQVYESFPKKGFDNSEYAKSQKKISKIMQERAGEKEKKKVSREIDSLIHESAHPGMEVDDK